MLLTCASATDAHSIIKTFNDTTHGRIIYIIGQAARFYDRVLKIAEDALASPISSLLIGGKPFRGTRYFVNSRSCGSRANYLTLRFRSGEKCARQHGLSGRAPFS